MPGSSRRRVLYVDAINTPHAQATIRGILAAYRKVSIVKAFDYRAIARHFGPKVPWSRPDIWNEPRWSSGVTRALFEMNQALVEEAKWFRPDFIHLGKCEYVYGQTAKTLKKVTPAYLAHFYGDLSRTVKPWVSSIGKYADVTLLFHKDPGIISAHLRAGCKRVGFWWLGTNSDVFYPRKVRKEDYDLIFMGRPIMESGNERKRLLTAMAGNDIKVDVFGGNWETLRNIRKIRQHRFVDEGEFAWACSRAKIALSVNANDVPMYASWRRIFNTMACGTFLLVRFFPGLETVFENGKHLVWYRSRSEAVRLAQRYLKDTGSRKRIAEAGRKEVLAHHTWDNRIAEMLSFAEES